MKTLALRARVFVHCFLVFGYPSETLAFVVHILHERLVRLSCKQILRENNLRTEIRSSGFWKFTFTLLIFREVSATD
jgi:hypothetical protein